MKKQSEPPTKAHVVRGALYLLLLSAGILPAFFRPQAPANLSHRTLTLAQRVGYQRVIEEIYWRHRIWPKERPDPKPSLDAVMSQAQLEKRVDAIGTGTWQIFSDDSHRGHAISPYAIQRVLLPAIERMQGKPTQ